MDDELWLAQERDAAGACPACGLRDPRPIVYGMPDFSAYDRLQDSVVFYGCCLPEVLHRWACGSCGREWGERRPLGEPEEIGPT